MARPKWVSCELLMKFVQIQNVLALAAPSADQGVQPCSHANQAVLESVTSVELLDRIIVAQRKWKGKSNKNHVNEKKIIQFRTVKLCYEFLSIITNIPLFLKFES